MQCQQTKRTHPVAGFKGLKARLLPAASLAILLFVACDVHGPTAPGTLARLVIAPEMARLSIGGTVQYSAVGYDADGRVTTVEPVWSVVAQGGAISSSGLFAAGTVPGTFTNTVQASSGRLQARATVVVDAGPLATVVVTPDTVVLPVGGTRTFTAVGRDAAGNLVPCDPTWSVVAGGGAIAAAGQFTAGVVPGAFARTVRATCGGMSGTASVTVTTGALATITVTPDPATLATGDARTFTAVGKDARGNVVAITPIWSVAAGGGTINAAGAFTAGAVPGTYARTVTASSGGLTGTATVIVTTGALATIVVQPNPVTLPIGGTQQFTAVGRDASGNIVPITPVWSVVAGGGAINAAGQFVAGVVPGTFANTVQAASGAITGKATVTVTTGSVASISVMPVTVTLPINGTQQFTAVGRDAGGNVVSITPTWAVVGGGGSISSTGLFTAGTVPGTFANTVIATSGGTTGHATVIVTTGTLAAITLTPNPQTLSINGVQSFTAVGTDAGGNVVSVTPTWAVVAGGGVISGTGEFTAGTTPGTFANTVTATSAGITGAATVNVRTGTLATITVTPSTSTLPIGGTQQYTAVGRDAGGNELAITPAWTIVAGGGAIGGTGLFTAGFVPGTFVGTVRATSGGIVGSASVTVTTGALAAITLLPDPAALAINGTQQFTAVGTDAGGNVVAITPTWSVAHAGGVIDATGRFTAGTVPGTYTGTVVATSGTISADATVIVTAGALATITLTPSAVTLPIGGTQTYTAVGKDAAGNVVSVTPVWSVVAGGGSISAAGILTAGSVPGTYVNTVQATSGGVTGYATITVTTGALASITVTPSSTTLPINGTQLFTAVGTDASGNVVAITPTWTVVAGGGSISAAGVFTAGTVPGTFTNTVVATSGAITGVASVTVTTGTLAHITVTPNPTTLPISGTRQFVAVGTDASGNVVALAPAWTIAAGGGAIDAAGFFTAGTVPGTFTNTVTATSGGVSGTATLTVTTGALATLTVTPNPAALAISATQQFTVVGRDAGGNVLAVTPTWSVVAGGGAVTGTGLFTAGVVPGTFTNTVRASSGGIVGLATVTVTTGALATITVTPAPATLAIGGTQQFSAIGRDAGGNVVAIAPTWTVAAGGGLISATALFTAGSVPGVFANTVTATVGAIVGTASVTVTAGPVASIIVTPNPATLAISGTQAFTAVGRDAGGNIVAITPVWSVAAGGGSTSAAGVFTAGTVPGTFVNTMRATSGSVSGAATVTVTTGALATITVTPGAATLGITGTQAYTAVGRDAGGNVVAFVPVWTLSAGGGSMSGAGLFTAGVVPGIYVNTVVASSGGISATATVTVTSGPVSTIVVTPDPATLAISGMQAFAAVGRDAGGNVVPIVPSWSVVSGGGAINGGGLFTAGTVPGTFTNTIVASANGVTGDATVIVTTGPLATITVTPGSSTLTINGTQQATAVGRDAGGNVVAFVPTWSVVAGGGTIGSTGLFTAGIVPGTFANTIQATSGAITGTSSVTVAVGVLATITVTPNPVTLAINGTKQYTAVGADAAGNVVAITPVWAVAAGGGVISGAGLFVAGTTPGTFANTVTASSGGVTGSATVTVISGPLAHITVTPTPVTLAINGTQSFTAVGRDAGGNVVPLTAAWSVVAGGGTVSAAGLFTAGTTPGTFTNTVQAASGSITGNASVTVTSGVLTTLTITPASATLPVLGTQSFTVVGYDAGGNVVASVPAWSVVAGGGVITGAGVFTAGTAPGTFANTVMASSGGVTATATVIVTTGVLASIVMTPNASTLPINGTQQYTAVGYDAGGNVVAITPVWSIVAGGGAISAAGLFTAGTVPGTFTNTITVSSGGVSSSTTVTVTTGAVSSVTVSPNPATLAINGTQAFTAVGRDAGGNIVAITPAWSVVAGGGVVSAGGSFTAGTAPGTFANTVVATALGVSGAATVVVTTGALASITVSPTAATLSIGGAQQYAAVGRDAGGNVVAITPVWSVIAGGGTMSAGGLFTAGNVPGTYTNTVQATSGSVSGAASVTVTTGVLATLTVSPGTVTLPISGVQVFTVVGRDAGGNVIAVAPAWSIIAGGGAIDAGGVFTAGTVPGTYTNTVTATSGGITGSASVTVTTGGLATITVTPNPVTLAISVAQQFTAVGRDAGGNVLAIAPTWSIVAGGGTISASGLFTAGTTPGTFAGTVSATSGGITGAATVTVITGALASITVTPSSVTLPINGTQAYTAVGRDAGGNVVAITPTWAVVAGGGAISAGGLFTAGIAPGTFANTVTASSGGVTGTASVTVTTGVLAAITLTPNPMTLPADVAQQFTAVGTDAGGNVVAISPTWTVVAGGGAISGTGLFTAGSTTGTFVNTVEATSAGITGRATVTVTVGVLASITVSPSVGTMAINGTQQFTAVGRDAGGNVVIITPAWSVVASGGTIAGAGLFTAGTTPGTFTNTVTATSGGITGTATVTVTTGPVATITVTPDPVTLAITGTQQFTAVGRDAGGNVVALTPTWLVVAGGGAINGTGRFTAGTAPGTFTNTVQASSGGITGTASVTVTIGALSTITVTPNPVTLAINGTQQFTAVGRDAGGNVVAIAPTWSVVALGGAVSGTGLFTAGTTPGTFTNTVQAASGSVTGAATVTVTTGALAAITVTPNPVTLAISGTQQFTAVGRDAGGNVIAIAPAWSVVAGGGTVSATGLFTAGTVPGTYTNTVTATSGSISGTATVIVTTGALATITVTPNPVTLPILGVQQFTAVGTDAGGNVLAIAPVWSLGAGGGAVSAAGLFTAGTVPGTYTNTVQATSGGITGRATVIVTTGALATITVTPNPVTLAINGTQQFTAVGRDAGGNVVAVTPTWSVVALGGAVSGTGLFTAGTTPGTFTNTVQAASGSVTGTATVTVTTGALATITVTPNPVTLAISGTQQFTAVGRDAGGNVIAIAPTWSVVALGGAVSGTGLFTAGTTPGTFTNTVQATSGAVSGTATVTVIAGALATITVTPNPTTLAINSTQQFTAVGRDAGGNVVALAPAWAVVAAGGAIDAGGLFTAGAVPGTYTNTVRASSGGVAGTATVTVTTGALATITVSPSPATLAINGTQQFTAVGRDAGGNVVALAPAWTVVASGGAIGATGFFTAGTTPGTFTNTVQASSGGIVGTATVIVSTGVLVTITVTPNPVTLAINGAQQFTAVGRDAGGNIVAFVPIWSVAVGGGAINSSGLFTAGTTPGTYLNTVQAASGAISGTATVTVTTGALATITVTPNPTTLAINGTQQFTAVGRDAGGNVVALAPAWTVVAGGGAINATGLFTASTSLGTFTNTVQASSGSIIGSATVTVTVGPLATITVSPNPGTTVTNGTLQFTAVGTDAGGNVVALAPTWSVVAGGGIISAGGLFTASFAAGTFTNTIRATSGSVSGFATVVLTAAPPAGPSLGAATGTGVLAGSTITCVATGNIGGDASVSPGTAITGFPPCVIAGTRHSADAAAAAAQSSLVTTLGTLGAMSCTTAISADLGGTTLLPGTYCGGAVGVTGTVTLDGNGDSNAIFVIRATSTLITAGSVVLTNGTQAANVYWSVGTSATLGSGSTWVGNILAYASITLNDGATVRGRVLANGGAVTMGTGNTITLP